MYKVEEAAEAMARDLADIEMGVMTNYTLADAIREGSKLTEQAWGWGDGQRESCALTAAFTAARAHNFII